MPFRMLNSSKLFSSEKKVWKSVTDNLPSEIVPVLSTKSLVTLEAFSSAIASFIKIPCFAPRPIPTIMAIGVAKPKAQGQAIINTENVLTKA